MARVDLPLGLLRKQTKLPDLLTKTADRGVRLHAQDQEPALLADHQRQAADGLTSRLRLGAGAADPFDRRSEIVRPGARHLFSDSGSREGEPSIARSGDLGSAIAGIAAIAAVALALAGGALAARSAAPLVRCPHAKGAYACMVRALSRTLASRYAPTLGVPPARLVTRYQVCNAPHTPTRFNCSFRTETRASGPATYAEGNVVATFARVSGGYARRSFRLLNLRCLKAGQPTAC